MRVGTLEAGGTKMVVGVADERAHILCRESIPTLSPDITMPAIIAYFQDKGIDALGVASFGPLCLRAGDAAYGDITNTPKLEWINYPLLRTLKAALCVPCFIDTDVNASALAEARLGAARGLKNCLYLTVGTGIGGGYLLEGRLAHGMIHSEMGHMPVAPRADDPMPKGCCAYHTACAEGLASGQSIEKRYGQKGATLPDNHPAWSLEAHYLAQICLSALYTISPERILLGGGVMGKSILLPMIRAEFSRMLGGYMVSPQLEDLDTYIASPALYPESGLVGGALLALEGLAET